MFVLESTNWISDLERIGVLAPRMTEKVTCAYLRSEWQSYEHTYARPMHKAAVNTTNKLDTIPLEFTTMDDETVMFRCKLKHSMESKNKKSEHFGYLMVAIHCVVQQHVDGYPVISKIRRSGCSCRAKASDKCWHVAAICFVIEFMRRPAASLIPQSTTIGERGWKRREGKICDIQMPACRLRGKHLEIAVIQRS
jgi:hypothetical protein